MRAIEGVAERTNSMNPSSMRYSHLHWLSLLAAARKSEQEFKSYPKAVSPVESQIWWLKIYSPLDCTVDQVFIVFWSQ